MSRILALTLALGLAALTLGGCGDDDGGRADDPAPTSASPSPDAPADEPTDAPPVAPTPTNTGPLPPDVPKGGGAKVVTVTGRVSLGVEPGCTLLEGGGRLYLLLGGPDVAGLAEGDRVTVTGTADPGIMTTCQQGLPLQVSGVSPA